MTGPAPDDTGIPRPGRVRTRREFAEELTLLRERAGLTVRQVAGRVDAHGAHSTVGDWFAGRGLPSSSSRDLLVGVLAVCGVSQPDEVEQWLEAWRRVRRLPGRRAAGPEPYRGLNAFQPGDVDWFFGRDSLTEELIDRLAGLADAGGGIQVVVGASGSGKSSLVRAGLIAALRAGRLPGSAGWPELLMHPGARPLGELAAGLAGLTAGVPADGPVDGPSDGPVDGPSDGSVDGPAANATAPAAEPTTVPLAFVPAPRRTMPEGPPTVAESQVPGLVAVLRADPAAGAGLVRRITSAATTGPAADEARLVLVVDQFEEVFTAGADQTDRRAFVAALSAAARPGGALVVLVLRADFYAQALRHPEIVAGVRAGQLTVGPMTEAELSAVIVEPARKAGVEIEAGLAELLLRDVAPRGGGQWAHDAGALPLLSHALYATWREGRRRRLTIADYRGVGGIAGAVAATASKVYDDLDEQQRQLARGLFLDLVHVAADTPDTRRRVTTEQLLAGLARPADLAEVLDRFVTQRLITADAGTVEISHEALLTAWPRLRGWLEAGRAGLIAGRRLAEAAATWQREGRDPAALYRGGRLVAAHEWVGSGAAQAALTPLAREFLQESLRRQEEERRAARRRSQRLRQLVAGLVVLLVLTATATVVAATSLRTTRVQRNAALSAKVAGEAAALRDTDPALAAQLSLAAYRVSPTAEARGSVLSTVANPYAVRLTGHTGAAYAAAFSTDGRILATAGTDRTVRLWDVGEPYRPRALATAAGHTADVVTAAFEPGGRLLVTADTSGVARLWDTAAPRRPREVAVLAGHQQGIRQAVFGPDGRLLATAGFDRTVRLWDVADPYHPRILATVNGHADAVTAAAISPDGRTLATGSNDHTVRLWDVRDRRRPALLATLTAHTNQVLAVAFSPDGRLLATGGFDNTLRLWDVTDPRRPAARAALTGHENGIVAITFSPQGHTIATGSYDHTVRLWDVLDVRFPGQPGVLAGHSEVVYGVAFSPDGRTLASASRDATVRLWDVAGPILFGHYGPVNSAVLSPDGRILVANSFRTARLWDVTDPLNPRPIAILTGYANTVETAAFSPDGRVLATANNDRTVRLWNVAYPHRPLPLATLTADATNVFTLAFSPDGRTMATGGADRIVRLWNVTDPTRPTPAGELRAHTDRVFGVEFAPNGHILASAAADHTARLWDLSDPAAPRQLATLTGHTNTVNSVAFSPHSKTLVTTSADHTARLWDISDPAAPRPLATLTGHTDTVNSGTFDPTGTVLATASFDRTIRIWPLSDPRNPGPSTTLAGHTNRVNTVRFSPNGKTIVTASTDTTVRIWDLDVDRVSTRICRLADTPITHAQWTQYLPDLDYQPPCR